MILTSQEAREAAIRLWRASFPSDRDPPSFNPLEDVARALAEKLPEPKTPEQRDAAVHVFMLWMGDVR